MSNGIFEPGGSFEHRGLFQSIAGIAIIASCIYALWGPFEAGLAIGLHLWLLGAINKIRSAVYDLRATIGELK